MVRLTLFLAFVTAAATGLAWLADRPGNLVINWQGYEIETSVFRAVVLLAALLGAALFVWSILRQIWSSPAAVGQFMARRRQQRGLEALSSGMIAIGAGDRSSATRYAIQARKALPNEPLTHLLRAQAAQLSGDGSTSRRIFEAMLASPDTEQLGLRGLFLEAQREKETEAARQFAERAMRLNPKLSWAVEQLFELQCKEKNWPGALETLATARRYGHVEKASADRRRMLGVEDRPRRSRDVDRAEGALVVRHLRRQGALQCVGRVGVGVVEDDVDPARALGTGAGPVDPHFVAALGQRDLEPDWLLVAVGVDRVAPLAIRQGGDRGGGLGIARRGARDQHPARWRGARAASARLGSPHGL